MTRHATVIGGGIGGLTVSVALQQRGWRVDTHERATGLPTTGTALGLWPAALAALDTLGLGGEARARGRRQEAGAFLRPDGSRIAGLRVDTTPDAVVLLSRPPLLRLLADAVRTDTLHFDSTVTDASAVDADVIIGADGINSTVRTGMFGPRYRPRYVGATAWRGTVDGDTAGTTETWGEGARFGITPQESGRTNWFACVRTAPGRRDPGHEVAGLYERFGHWHADVRRVLAAVREDSLLRHDLYELAPPLPSYVAGRRVLLGDAAHAMTPDLGRGACEALVDAVTLADCLTDHAAVPDALADYDARRRRRTQRLARASRAVNRMAHARRLLPLRDAALRLSMALSPM